MFKVYNPQQSTIKVKNNGHIACAYDSVWLIVRIM